MKVVGLGAPASVRIRFQVRELDVLVDVLREQRARATREASDTYARVSAEDARSIDESHDELRAIEGLLMQLEEQRPDETGRVVLVARTVVMYDVVRAGAREALQRLQDAHDRYPSYGAGPARDALLDAAETAKAWLVTLTSFDRVDGGPDE